MSNPNDDQTQPPELPEAPEPTEPPQARESPRPADTRRRWRDRTLSFRGVVAVALAGLVVGGLGGAAIHAVADGDHERDGRFGPPFPMERPYGDRGFPDDDLRQGFPPPGLPAPVPPTTSPDDDTQPDSGSTDSPSSNS